MTTEERKAAFAKEAVELTKVQLRRKLPVLAEALLVPGTGWTDRGSGIDMRIVWWNVQEVLLLFEKGTKYLERQYLHMLLHGLYLHGLRTYICSEQIWWLACDMMTEYRIDRMNVPGFSRPVPAERSWWYRKLKEEKVPFQERQIVRWAETLSKEMLLKLEACFQRDDHTWWREKAPVSASKITREEKQHRAEQAGQTAEAEVYASLRNRV